MKRKTPLHTAVEHSKGERTVHRELENRPWLVQALVAKCQGFFVISHFKLGAEYEADFIVLEGFSGGWEIHFIELEPPSMSPFNKKGDFSPRMNHAVGQIRRWKEFKQRHDKKPYLVAQLRDAVMKKDLLLNNGREPIDSASRNITHPESMLIMRYYIVMGRRGHLNSELMARKANLSETDGFELITYDRVLEVYDKMRKESSYSGI